MRKHIMDPTGINEEHFDVVCQETRDSILNCMSMSKLWLDHDVVIDVHWTRTAQTGTEMSRAA